MGWFSSCEHEYHGYESPTNGWATHECSKCGKKERCTSTFKVGVSDSSYRCTTCGQNLDYTKNAK